MEIKPFITPRQRDVVSAIRELSEQGRNPTLKELCRRIEMRSTGTLRRHLSNLEAMGILQPRRYNKHRQIALTEQGAAA